MRRSSFFLIVGLASALLLMVSVAPAHADRLRKYKSPPPVSHIEVTVLKASTGKPLKNAAVVIHPMKGGRDKGDMELKTNEQGKATLDMVPIGAHVLVQVIVPGYRTFGQEYDVPTSKKLITIKLLPPDQQYSIYAKNHPTSEIQNNTPQTQMGHAAPADSPLLAPAEKKH